jgi:hybrid cluster-associated redox disulfide protein
MGYGILHQARITGMRRAERPVKMQQYTADMLISDVLVSHPEAVAVFNRFGLGCPSCLAAELETLQSVATMHDVPVESLLEALQDLPAAEDQGV